MKLSSAKSGYVMEEMFFLRLVFVTVVVVARCPEERRPTKCNVYKNGLPHSHPPTLTCGDVAYRPATPFGFEKPLKHGGELHNYFDKDG